MKISFKRPELDDLAHSLSREWIELEAGGNYSSSTILGSNTRKKHGLFLIPVKTGTKPFLVLSHLQEEVFIDKEAHPLYNVEYQNHPVFAGLKYLEKFELDPFPTFHFSCRTTRIEKSLCLLPDKTQLIILYQIQGDVPPGTRLVVRPFFAFRLIDENVNPEHFENTETFIMDRQFRFLPNPELPEIFMQYSAGQFINSPVWYHNFVYRHERPVENPEDLLNPGFFEVGLEKNNPLYLSITLQQVDPAQLPEQYDHEKKQRSLFLRSIHKRTEAENYLFGKICHFQNVHYRKSRFFGTDLFDKTFYLSMHCLMNSRLLQSGIEWSEVHKYYESLITLLKNSNLEELLQGMEKEIKVDPATPFFIIFFLYHYHLQHDRGEAVFTSIEVILQILELIRKNKLIYYKLKRNKLLERQYRKSDLEPKSDYEIFYPLRQNFILNIFWYNALNMVIRLAAMKKVRVRRYHGWVKKIKQRFYHQYVRTVIANPYQANEKFAFAFHPSMIYALTFPFPLLEEKPAQIFYRLLIKQFLTESGIKYPLRVKDPPEFINSPILIGDYLDGWEMIMKDKEFLLRYFQTISRHFEQELRKGILGYIPHILDPAPTSQEGVAVRPSGMATTEVLYFFHRLNQIIKK